MRLGEASGEAVVVMRLAPAAEVGVTVVMLGAGKRWSDTPTRTSGRREKGKPSERCPAARYRVGV